MVSAQTRILDEDERRLLGKHLADSGPGRNGEWRAFCPECEQPGASKSPSASFNFPKGIWRCFSCERSGKINKLLGRLLREERGGEVIDINTRKPPQVPSQPLPTAQNIRNWTKVLLADQHALRMMRERRGLAKDTLVRMGIGYSAAKRRYTIPVYDRDGKTLLAVKLYKPNARNPSPKMIWFLEDGNVVSLYNAKALDESDIIYVTEGEPDCWTLLQHGFPAVAHTAGAGGFQLEWAAEFKGKTVYLVPDEDEPGMLGAVKTAKILAEFAKSVYIIDLRTGIKSGDVTDFFHKQNHTAYDFEQLRDSAEQFSTLVEARPVAKEGLPVSLAESQNPAYGTDALELIVSIAGKQSPPYLAPRRIVATCDRKKGDRCKSCPMTMYAQNAGLAERIIEPSPDDSDLLRFIGSNDVAKKRVMVGMAHAKCDDHINFTIEDEWSLEELVLVQSVGHRTEEAQMPLSRKAFNVGTYRTPVNSTVRLVGRQLADPRDSRGIFHGWHLDPVEVDIDRFKLTPDLRDELRVFQRARGQSSLDKCMEIARDLAANVTRIYGRDLLHVATDLVYHSVLSFDFQGKRVTKGWLEGVVIGDTRTGKSETAYALASHYNAGLIKSCEGATFAGLVGGATQMPQGSGWMVTWGTLPLHDRRLVVLDEFSGIKDKDIIEQMSAIRSSGIAQLTKIVSEETSARTRLLWISNDPDGKPMAETDGMSSLMRLVKNPEDIARFDFAMALSNADVPSGLINAATRSEVEHVYNHDLCSALVLWAWSRKPEQVRWGKGVEDAIIAQAEEIGSRYVSAPPLIQVENVRMKLARIAVALAARTFSCTTSGESLLVRPEHVSGAVAFLDAIYGSEVMGYLRHSRRTLARRETAESNKRLVRTYLRKNPIVLDALRVVGRDKFRLRDFEDYGMLEGTSAVIDPRTLVHQLISWNMIRRLVGDRGYIVMEPALIEVLKELEDQGL